MTSGPNVTTPAEAVPFLAKAARPNLFDVIAEPDLMISLILADLMEPSLWDLAERIRRRGDASSAGGLQELPDERIHRMQRYLDHHLVHWGPRKMPDLWGTLSIEDERARLGAACVDYAVRSIVHNIEDERSAGVMPQRDDVVPLIRTGWFPDYEYATFDVIRAQRSRFHGTKHKPLGITSCADEAILISSLSVAAGLARLEDLVIIGSPVHYSVMLRTADGPYWFSGKHEVFREADWRAAVARQPGLTPQLAFTVRADLDRIITSQGAFLFAAAQSSIPKADLDAIMADIVRFFGASLDQLRTVDLDAVTYRPDPKRSELLEDLDCGEGFASTHAAICARAAAFPGSVPDAAVYGYRALDVGAPQAYLRVALRGCLVRDAAATCDHRDAAIGFARAIAGTQSILGDRDRIAMPDEVILFRTGSDRDKALLVFCLITLAEAVGVEEKRAMELVFTQARSFLAFGSTWMDAGTWQATDRPADPWRVHLTHADLDP